jgi:hypothetical protein|tara:strand:- start:162 stop:611 length:450 start_codon:yes stop_codon:yes gene_type:complete
MSEISSYQTRISIPSLAKRTRLKGNIIDQEPRASLLKRAMELIVEDHGGKMMSQVKDCDGKTIPCLLGVSTPQCQKGVGVVVDKGGNVSFVYDAHGDDRGWGKKIAGEISANYNAIATRLALQAMNFEVSTEDRRPSQGQRLIQVEGRV